MKNKQFALILLMASLLTACGGSESTVSNTPDTDTSTIQTTGSLVINEIVASAADGGNDWIELYAVDVDIQLSDYGLVDDNAEHTIQTLPSYTLKQGEFIVIQAIDETDTPPEDGFYVTFKLGSDDAVYLYRNNELVDSLDWQAGDAPEGYSYGLYTDGTGSAQTLTPTPGQANALADEHNANQLPSDTVINHDAAIRINEISAKSIDGADDWVEFYVTGDNSVFLGDYTLADDNGELMPLPEVTLHSGQFYRVYASTTETDVNQNNRVNLQLGASDSLRLYQGDDLIDTLEWSKGQALYGYSYGRYPDGSDGTHTLVPSAQASNQLAERGQLIISEIVANDANGGMDWFELYNNSTSDIQLADYQVIDESSDIEPITLPNVVLQPHQYIVIYATKDETTALSVPFKLGNEDELSLLLNNETVDYIKWDASDVIEGYSYGYAFEQGQSPTWQSVFLTPTAGEANHVASAFDTSQVQSLYFTISNENWQDILDNPLDEEYHETSVTLNGVTLDSVAIRTKGGSSLRSVAESDSERYSFKIDINKYVDGQKFFGLKKFTLQNSFNDPSFMRETIAYDLLDELGVPTPQHSYVNVYINNELLGLYLMVEAVDGEFIQQHFSNSHGDLYKPDGVGSDLVWISDNIADYTDINPQSNEETTDHGAFIDLVNSLANGETSQIDVDMLLRYMAVSVALSNGDSYFGSLAHNYYLYEQDGVFSLLPWDFNESFGTFTMGCDNVDIREMYIDEPYTGPATDRPFVANVFANSAYLTQYHQYLSQLINGALASENFATKVNNIANLIDESVANDPTKFYSYSEFKANLTSTVDRFYGLTDFINYRRDNIQKQLTGELPSAGDGSGFCSGNTGMRPF
jgi:spore coat protein CotH